MAIGKVFENGVGWRDFAASDIPASGVSAGTYGDASHVGQFTVGADGRISAASNVATGGGGSSGLTQLFDSTLAADAASIDTGAGGIATSSTQLFIFCRLRTADAAANGDCMVRFNNDSGANYGVNYVGGVSTGTPSVDTATGQTAGNFLTMCGNTAAANAFGVLVAHIVAYSGTSAVKVMDFTAQSPGSLTGSLFSKTGLVYWNSTAAISRMAVLAQSGANLKAGSRLTIYGT